MPSDTHQVWGGLDWYTNRPGHPLGGWQTNAQIRENLTLACFITGENGSFYLYFRPKVNKWCIPCAVYKQGPEESRERFAARLAIIFREVVTGLGGKIE